MTELLAPAPTSPERQTESRLKYIFCEHTPQMVPRMVEEIGDAEVVAVEQVGGVAEFRKEMLGHANALTRLPKRSPETRKQWKEFLSKQIWVEGDFFTPLLHKLKGSNKEIRHLDIEGMDAAFYSGYLEGMEAQMQQTLLEQSREEAVEYLKTYLDTFAQMNAEREETVKRQIEELQAEFPGKKIAIIAGIVHRPIADANISSGQAEQVFVQSEHGTKDEPFLTPFEEALLQRNTDPQKELSEEQIKRILLELASLELGFDDIESGEIAYTAPIQQLDSILDETLDRARIEWQKQMEEAEQHEMAGQR